MFLHLDLCAVLNWLGLCWSVLGLGWLGMLILVKSLFDETWDMSVESAVGIVQFELDVHVQLTLPVDCDVVPSFESLNKMVSVSIAFYLDAEIVHY